MMALRDMSRRRGIIEEELIFLLATRQPRHIKGHLHCSFYCIALDLSGLLLNFFELCLLRFFLIFRIYL